MSRQEYKKPDGHIDLIAAIIKQAIADYRHKSKRADVKRFIRGEWFGKLTTLDPDWVLEQLKERYGE